MNIFEGLKPTEVWTYFEEILQIPRPSTKEEKIISYLKKFAEKNNLEILTDKVNNVLIRKPATKGMENVKSVVLQGHIDMVCEKNNDKVHDFENDAIEAFLENGWVKAKGTTLGADDGIGVAVALAVLSSTNIKHGPIECLFTVDEESGMTGAFGLEEGFLNSDILINLDSEDEGELFIGCAGGIDTVAQFLYKKRKPAIDSLAFKINVTGLKGGHSGDEINKGLGNSNKIVTKFLYQLTKIAKFRLAIFDGGNLRNAIPREAHAIFTLKSKFEKDLNKLFVVFVTEMKNQLKVTEPDLEIKLEKVELPKRVINKSVQENLINALYACPHGVYAMSQDIEGLVETSTNLASVKFIDGNIIQVVTSQRSSVESAKKDISHKVESVFKLAKAEISHNEGYPGWTPNTNSDIMLISQTAYRRLFNIEPKVKAIHAGLECGLFLTKYPKMDMISFGPTIKGAHSPDERMEIKTVEMFWDLVVEILSKIPVKN